MRRAVRNAARALACFGLSVLAAWADARWIRNPGATDLMALIFVPLALSFVLSLAMLANVALTAVETHEARKDARKPDYRRIAELEADVFRDGAS